MRAAPTPMADCLEQKRAIVAERDRLQQELDAWQVLYHDFQAMQRKLAAFEQNASWLEAERADYRLSHCWRVAGDAAQALAHAQACLDTVMAQPGAPALERFFGHEALALACQAAGDGAGLAASRTAMQQAFDELAADDQAWCRATLEAVTRAASS